MTRDFQENKYVLIFSVVLPGVCVAAESPLAHGMFRHDVAQSAQCYCTLMIRDWCFQSVCGVRLSTCYICVYLYIVSADIYFALPVANDNPQKDLSLTNIKSNMCPICIKLAG